MYYTADVFRYSAATKRFTAFASDFRSLAEALRVGSTQPQYACVGGFVVGQIYPDAADAGIVMQSVRTGAAVRYYLAHEEVQDGDLRWLDFKPVPEDEHRIPGVRGTSVRVFND